MAFTGSWRHRMPLPAKAAAGRPVRLPASTHQAWAVRCILGGFILALGWGWMALAVDGKSYWVFLVPQVVAACLLFALEHQYRRHLRRGFVLAIEPAGVRFLDVPLIRWEAVRSVDVGSACSTPFGQAIPCLVLALERTCYEAVRDNWPRSWPIQQGHVDDASCTVFLGLQQVQRTPQQVEEIADAAWRRHREMETHHG